MAWTSRISKLLSAVSIINDVIQQEASRCSFDILELRTLVTDKADYANPIEPSAIGGAKLAKRISDWVSAGRSRDPHLTPAQSRVANSM
jgi:hypothetical protein